MNIASLFKKSAVRKVSPYKKDLARKLLARSFCQSLCFGFCYPGVALKQAAYFARFSLMAA